MTQSIRYVFLVCLWPQLRALLVGNSAVTPKFYILDRNLDEMYQNGFQSHPARVGTLEEADFAVTCCFNGKSLQKFADLPRRSKAKPYLVMVRGLRLDRCSKDDNCQFANELIEQRDDFMYVNFDLRDQNTKDDDAQPLRGVTITPPKWYTGSPLNPLQDPKHFMTFRGRVTDGSWLGFVSQHVRAQLQKGFADFKSDGVVVELFDRSHKYGPQDSVVYNDLLNTAYALLPHGDGRWNYRFSEVVGACSIPVVIADGLTLPYEELIDWRDAAVFLHEETWSRSSSLPRSLSARAPNGTLSLDPAFLLSQLPRDPAQIRKMRQRVCEINDKYFATAEKRITAMLQSAAIRVQQ